MSEYSIEKANFEKQKNKLKRFAEQPATSTALDKFDTDGQWSDFWSGGIAGVLSGHKVTGEELNVLVTELQSCFVEINEREKKVIKEFGQVYETFEVLDKEYIHGILISVKSAEKVSRDVKKAQKDIDDTIQALQITIDKLKDFKDEIDRYNHLKDIDGMWNDIHRANKRISGVVDFKEKLEEYKHLGDIDSMWGSLREAKQKILSYSEELKEIKGYIEKRIKEVEELHEKDIKELKEFTNSQEHFMDIDNMWSSLNEAEQKILSYSEELDEIKGYIEKRIKEVEELHEKDIKKFEEFTNSQEHFLDIDNMWSSLHETEQKILSYSEELGEIKGYIDNRLKEVEELHENDIKKLEEFTNSQEHFLDIDNMWSSLNEAEQKILSYSEELDEIKRYIENRFKEVEELHEKDIKELRKCTKSQEHFLDIDTMWSSLHEVEQKILSYISSEDRLNNYQERISIYEQENTRLKRGLNMAYIFAGSALGISIVQIIMLLTGIL